MDNPDIKVIFMLVYPCDSIGNFEDDGLKVEFLSRPYRPISIGHEDVSNGGLRMSDLKAVAEEFIGSQLGISAQVQQQVIGQVSMRIKSTGREGASKVYRLEGTVRINPYDKS